MKQKNLIITMLIIAVTGFNIVRGQALHLSQSFTIKTFLQNSETVLPLNGVGNSEQIVSISRPENIKDLYSSAIASPIVSGVDILVKVKLPDRYFRLLEAGILRVEQRLEAEPEAELPVLEARHGWENFAAAILMPAVLYKKTHPDNVRYGDTRLLVLAKHLGDLLATENEKGRFANRPLHAWDTYMWLETYRLLENELEIERRELWKKALLENLALIEHKLDLRKDYPWYKAPFIITSPNHYSIYASTVLLGGRVFGKPQWEQLAVQVLHRFSTQEQSVDGYWGEFDNDGPTTGYDYLTMTQIALYWEYSKDPVALEALRRSTDFHKYYTYLDGTPVETINDRNRYWGVSMWGHFGFSHFPDGRRYAAFLTGFVPPNGGDWLSLGRIAQNALYYHEGNEAPIPQDQTKYFHAMKVPAGIRKTGPWVVCLSGLLGTPENSNNFFLDRQGNLSIFHEKCGLIITGANSKLQHELATFTEKSRSHITHTPLTSRLQMGDKMDKLALGYDVFFAEPEVPVPSDQQLKFHVATTYKWGKAEAKMTLQLVLKAGQVLETGTGKKIILGREKINLDASELGGWIRHNGWTLRIPQGMELNWPIFPYNPYTSSPEINVDRAVGTLSIALWSGMKEKGDQEFPFTLEID